MRHPTEQRPPDLAARAAEWFGVDSGWERVPADPRGAYRNDVYLAAFFTAVAVVAAELARSFGQFEDVDQPAWLLYLLSGVAGASLAWRRRRPLLTVCLVYAQFLAVGLTVPMVTALAPLQVLYFVALYTAVAWAGDRRAMLLVAGFVVLAMLAWLAWQLAVGAGIDDWLDEIGTGDQRPGLLPPVTAYVISMWLVNLAYFGGAVVAGQLMWHAARRREQLADQADTIERQAEELQRQAVVAERLRIARELHDVVAHHVSVIGIQAAAARRVLTRDPAAAAAPLATIEGASRDAVTQMRSLLGTLRDVDRGLAGETASLRVEHRAPEPGLAEITRLAEEPGVDVTYRLVEDPAGAAAEVPETVGLSLYRTTQEALANVRRHSTARGASVVVRVERRPGAVPGDPRFRHGFAEVEVLDDGRSRPGTSGTGLGMLGIRERVATHGGVAEIGPRATGGYRVRVRLPLPEECP